MSNVKMATPKDISNSRLWANLAYATPEVIARIKPAFSGHTFVFVTDTVKFLDMGDADARLHSQNLKTLMEKCVLGVTGQNNIVVNYDEQTDGFADRTVRYITGVEQATDEITVTLHEFDGLVTHNAMKKWVYGIVDRWQKKGNYYGLTDSGTLEYGLQNHSMAILVVQVSQDWLSIQNASWYTNLTPVEIPLEFVNWTKGEISIIKQLDMRFKANLATDIEVVNAAAITAMQKIIAIKAKEVLYNDVKAPTV